MSIDSVASIYEWYDIHDVCYREQGFLDVEIGIWRVFVPVIWIVGGYLLEVLEGL